MVEEEVGGAGSMLGQGQDLDAPLNLVCRPKKEVKLERSHGLLDDFHHPHHHPHHHHPHHHQHHGGGGGGGGGGVDGAKVKAETVVTPPLRTTRAGGRLPRARCL